MNQLNLDYIGLEIRLHHIEFRLYVVRIIEIRWDDTAWEMIQWYYIILFDENKWDEGR